MIPAVGRTLAVTLSRRHLNMSGMLMADDPIKQMFISKIREYASKEKSTGGEKLVDAPADMQKQYDNELDRVSKMFGADKEDFTKFPTFQFQDPKLEDVDMERPVV